MSITYLNHSASVAQSRRDRRSFLANWWRIYAGDPRWVPPHYLALRRELELSYSPHLARMAPVFIKTEALPRRQSSLGGNSWPSPGWYGGGLPHERTVTAAVALRDPRRRDGTVYLALFRCVNHAESLEHLLDRLTEILWANGCQRLVGPTGLSPHLESGLLVDYWNRLPPAHTPYNPPYMPELVTSLLEPLACGRLYHLEIPHELPLSSSDRAELYPLDPARLATDLLPLLALACVPWADFPAPDTEEAAFLLRWLSYWPLYGWVAQADGQSVGFLLLQPDVAPVLRRARGGRHLVWRLWLAWLSRRPVQHGRVLYGAVLPHWQGRGVGRQLLHQAMLIGRRLGWRTLSVGPLPSTAPACTFLEHCGASPCQTYWLYQRDL